MGDFEKNARIVRERKEREAKLNQERAKNDLSEKCRISINTVGVGALVEIEEALGHLWGHNAKTKTVEQERNKSLWEQARTAILDRSQEATEKMSYHINRFTVEYKESDKKYNYSFKPVSDKNTNNNTNN